MITWVDGEPAREIPTDDRGLAYGDGLFETMAVEAGRIRLFDRHLERAALGCRRLGFPAVEWPRIGAQVAALLAAHPALARHAVARLTITRGAGATGYRPGAAAPRVILSLRERPAAATDCVHLRWCRTIVPSDPALAGIKHLNRLPQVMARAEWADESIFDGLMCDRQGRVACGTMTNVFIVSEGQLRTPDLSQGGVAGVMRACVLEAAAALGIEVSVRHIEAEDVTSADEVVVTNAVRGMMPVASLAGHQFDAPGAVTARLRGWLETRRWPW